MVDIVDSALINTAKYFGKENTNKWANKNVYGVSISMVMVFTAFVGLQNLQSTINSENSLGLISLSVIYGFFVVSGVFTPTVLRAFGTKNSLLIGYVCHLIYTLCNYYPSFYTLVPGSVLIGLSSGPIWAATGSHLAQIAIKAKVALKKEQGYLISNFTGIFFCVFQFSQLPGNLSSSLILFPYTSSNSSMEQDSASSINMNFSLVSAQFSSPLNSTDVCDLLENATIDVTYIYILVSVYSLFIIFGIAALFLSVDKLQTPASSAPAHPKMEVYLKQPLLEMLSVIKNWKMILLAPMALYTGMECAFAFGTFTRVYISECLGTYHVGFALMILGLNSSLMSFVCSKLVKCLPRYLIILVGTTLHLTVFIFLALWEREPSYYVVYGGVVLWGCGHGLWNTIGTSMAGILFPKKLNAAFSVLRIWVALGFMSSYVTANLVPVAIRAWILVGLIFLTVISMLIIEFSLNSKEQLVPCYYQRKLPNEGKNEAANKNAKMSSENVHVMPIYSTALFEACGSIILSDMTTSFVYRVNGEASSSTSSDESEHLPSQYNLHSTQRSTRSQLHRVPSPTYSHKSEICQPHSSRQSAFISSHNSAPLFAQYTGRSLSHLSTSFVNTVIQANKSKTASSSARAVRGASSASSDSLFEVYAGEGLTNLSSTFLHTTEIEKDGTLSNMSSTSAFQEYESEGLINLSTSFLDKGESTGSSKESLPDDSEQLNLDYTCDSIDGTQPLTQSNTYSFSYYLRSMRPSQRARITNRPSNNVSDVPQSDCDVLTSTSRTRATSAPASSTRTLPCRSLVANVKIDEHNKHEGNSASHSETKHSSNLHNSVSNTITTSHTIDEFKSGSSLAVDDSEQDSRSDVIYVGPATTHEDSDTDDESVWTSITLSRYSV